MSAQRASLVRDQVFDRKMEVIPDFVFDERVAHAFDDMAGRSIPAYDLLHTLSASLIANYAQTGSTIYDLGCSTGSFLLRLLMQLPQGAFRYVGVDQSDEMLKRAEIKLGPVGEADVELRCEDISKTAVHNASACVLHYTLQFCAPERRLAILQNVYRGMLPGGCLIVSEKVRHEPASVESLMTAHYYEFKRRNGYSELEIAQKREALERVMRPFTIDENQALFRAAKFTTFELIQKSYHFTTWLAVKDRQ